jgi:hypothetical protein
MTIVVGVAAPDGIVLASDSRTTGFPDGMGAMRHRIVSDSAQKLFAVCGRFAVATYGDAFIGDKTIRGLMDEFGAHLGDDHPDGIEEFPEVLGAFFHERYAAWRNAIGVPLEAGEAPQLGFLVAGYDADGIGHLREVFIPGPTVEETGITTSERGHVTRGTPGVVDRLLAGVDWSRVPSEHPFSEDALNLLGGLEYELIRPIALQDALDFATFQIRTTIDMQRFSDGTRATRGGIPGCGGPVQIVTVKSAQVEWISSIPLSANRIAGRAEGALD